MDERELGEKCQQCGTRYLTVWGAPADLWQTVSKHIGGSGLLCISCFDANARAMGITLYWDCNTSPSGAAFLRGE